MNEQAIFTAALELDLPWYIKSIKFEEEGDKRKLHLQPLKQKK